MPTINPKSIKASVLAKMQREAGFRERDLMKKADVIYTSNNGRCIRFLHTESGRFCQFDLKTGHWIG